MQRAGRIGGDILDIYRLPLPCLAATKGVALFKHSAHDRRPERGIDTHIDEAGAGNGNVGDAFGLLQPSGNGLCEVARLEAGGFGENHGRIGGDVAMRGVTRRFHDDPRGFGVLRQRSIGNQPINQTDDGGAKMFKNIQGLWAPFGSGSA